MVSASGVMVVGGFVGFAALFLGVAWNVASFVRWKRGSLAAGRLLLLGVAILTGTAASAVLVASVNPFTVLGAAFLYSVTALILFATRSLQIGPPGPPSPPGSP